MKKIHPFSTVAAVATCIVLAGSVLSAGAAESGQTYQFRSQRKPGNVDRVVGLLEIGGQLKEVVDEKVQSLTMSVECNFSYDEKTVEVPAGAAGRWARFATTTSSTPSSRSRTKRSSPSCVPSGD